MEEKDKIVFKGSHPDSLYRVPVTGMSTENKIMRAARVLRWPAALLLVCIALAVFVYFLVPETNDMQFMSPAMNSTLYSNPEGAHLQPPEMGDALGQRPQSSKTPTNTGTKTTEIDFYDSNTEVKNNDLPPIFENPDLTTNKNLPVPPVFPSHIVPEVQYGNERADSKGRTSKVFIGQPDKQPEDSTLKPHITQKPEKPLAIYFKDGAGLTTSTETIVNAESSNIDYQGKSAVSKEQINSYTGVNNINNKDNNEKTKILVEIHDINNLPLKPNVHFTSGHSKLFGISIEDAEKLKSTTQSSIYNTRVSPTLPVLHDLDDTTTTYPVIINSESSDGQPQCRSTQLPMCRGILPYDLTSMSTTSIVQDITSLLPHFEYLVANNCSERARQFSCILLEPECSPPPLRPRLPCYDLCKAVMDGCEGQIPQQLLTLLVCHRYPRNNCVKPRNPCFEGEMACKDGSCILKDWVCDGKKDCSAGEDESKCSQCAVDEFTCPTGECIQKRWLCDGYSDCPKGEDEVETTCVKHRIETRTELGEESAGSAPAASFKRPNHLPAPQHFRQSESYREDSSELLMTSDTSNPYKRNYTRRLTPYKRPIINVPKFNASNDTQKNDIAAKTIEVSNNNSVIVGKDIIAKVEDGPKSKDFVEETVLDKFYHEFEKELEERKEELSDKRKVTFPALRKQIKQYSGSLPKPHVQTLFEKSINSFERVIEGNEFVKKKPMKNQIAEPMASEDTNSSEIYRPNETLMSAHASPCPSSELRCVDGRCITLSQLCDGVVDCTDHSDEDNCYT